MFQIQTGAVRGEVFQNLVSIGKDDTGVDVFGEHLFVCVCVFNASPQEKYETQEDNSFLRDLDLEYQERNIFDIWMVVK